MGARGAPRSRGAWSLMADGSGELAITARTLVALVNSGSIEDATDAMLGLTYHEEDQQWHEAFLVSCLAPERDPQIRALAVTCLGHVGRMFGSISSPLTLPELTALLDDPGLGGRAEDALADIGHFAADPRAEPEAPNKEADRPG
jgi:hypothetical protein